MNLDMVFLCVMHFIVTLSLCFTFPVDICDSYEQASQSLVSISFNRKCLLFIWMPECYYFPNISDLPIITLTGVVSYGQ